MSLNYKEKYGLCDFLLFVSVLLPSPLTFSSFDGPSTKNVLSANKMGVAEIKKDEQPKKEPFTTFVILFNNMLRYCCRFFFFFFETGQKRNQKTNTKGSQQQKYSISFYSNEKKMNVCVVDVHKYSDEVCVCVCICVSQ